MPPAATPDVTDRWHVIIPIKNLDQAKSRLRVAPDHRRQLMAAFVTDVIDACRRCPLIAGITVVTDNSWGAILPVDVTVIADPGGSLNDAVRAGLDVMPARSKAAIVVGDLPCARADDLASLLRAASQKIGIGGWAAVPDRKGTGTTVLLGDRSMQPAFGPSSYHRHLAAGATPLDEGWASLRLDVDDDRDVAAAVALGVGPATRGALADFDERS